MLTRRKALMTAGAVLAAPATLRAADRPVIKVGLLEFGTAAWEFEVIRHFGLDAAAGLRVEAVKLASTDAARIAFLGGGVDTIVGDLLWAARLRAEGRDLVFLPFSSSEGALMVPAGSTIRSVADLKGRKLGIAGGALDKNWLLLQGMARQTAGIDLARSVQPAFGAPPLLSQKLESGELDAALLYWNFCARLEAKGFKRLLGADEILKRFGIDDPVSFLGYVFDPARLGARAGALPGFAAASREAKQRLQRDDDTWALVRPLMQAEDQAMLDSLRRAFLAGVPRRPIEAERADAQRLFALLAGLGGEKLVGPATRLPDGLYWTAPS